MDKDICKVGDKLIVEITITDAKEASKYLYNSMYKDEKNNGIKIDKLILNENKYIEELKRNVINNVLDEVNSSLNKALKKSDAND